MLRDAETSAAKPERAIAPVQEINLKSIDQQKLEVSIRVTLFKDGLLVSRAIPSLEQTGWLECMPG